MFYLLLILPHLLAIIGLLAFALNTAAAGQNGDADESSDGGGGLRLPPSEPEPVTPSGGLPLFDSDPPHRRLRVGERLSELYPDRLRRDVHPDRPQRTPTKR